MDKLLLGFTDISICTFVKWICMLKLYILQSSEKLTYEGEGIRRVIRFVVLKIQGCFLTSVQLHCQVCSS